MGASPRSRTWADCTIGTSDAPHSWASRPDEARTSSRTTEARVDVSPVTGPSACDQRRRLCDGRLLYAANVTVTPCRCGCPAALPRSRPMDLLEGTTDRSTAP